MDENKQLEYSIYSSTNSFELAQRAAKSLAESTLLPKEYLKNIPNVMIALELANRIKMSPFMVMQNLYIVNGRPSWSSKFLIAVINNSGRFDPLQFRFEGEGDEYGCIAFTKDRKNTILESPKVTWSMVKQEGWLSKNGSKWKTMPQIMFRYRAASFFSSFYCPEITMGMNTAEEVQDMQPIQNDTKNIEIDKISDLGTIELVTISDSNKAEPVKAEPVKAEPVKQEPIKQEPVKQEPIKQEPVKQEPIKQEPVKQEPVKQEPVKQEPVKNEIVDHSTGEITYSKKDKSKVKTITKQKKSEYDELSEEIEKIKNSAEIEAFKKARYNTLTDGNVFTIFEQNDLIKQLEDKEQQISF